MKWPGFAGVVDLAREVVALVREVRRANLAVLEAQLEAERAARAVAEQRAHAAERARDIEAHFSSIDRRGQ